MTRVELLIRFAKAALASCDLANMASVTGDPSSRRRANAEESRQRIYQGIAKKCWEMAHEMVDSAPTEVAAVFMGGSELDALEESRVLALLAERHPYCEKPLRIMHVDKTSELQGEEQCKRCKQLTDAGAARLKELTEIAANQAVAENARRGKERLDAARKRRRERDKGDDEETAGVVV